MYKNAEIKFANILTTFIRPIVGFVNSDLNINTNSKSLTLKILGDNCNNLLNYLIGNTLVWHE